MLSPARSNSIATDEDPAKIEHNNSIKTSEGIANHIPKYLLSVGAAPSLESWV